MRTTRFTSTLVVALSTLALAACGEDGGGSGGGDTTADGRKDGALKFARCMRENGVDMPDPKTDENGMVVIEGGGKNESRPGEDPDFEKADAACRKHLQDALPPKISEEQAKEFKEKALAHAKCMREQGVDFPDPRIGEGGEVSVEIGADGLDPQSPKFKAAQEKCGSPLGAPGETP